MQVIYNLLIIIVEFALKCIAPFSHKIKLGIEGRRKTFDILKEQLSEGDKTIWFHCASLGEYEQGFPVFKSIREQSPNHKIILSFFSPSGYEIRKNTNIADCVVYLPMDTARNTKRFIELVNPDLSIFVKYEVWPNYLNQLSIKNLKAILISASFRKSQPYFKFYGRIFRRSLFAFDHIFTQNNESKFLLESIGFKNASVSGDTRFDRVSMQLHQDNTLDFIETFIGHNICFVAGSTWPEDELVLKKYINNRPLNNIKFIVAPHNINQSQIQSFSSSLNKRTILFSQKNDEELKNSKVLIVDTIGLLSKIYSYADIAYVGGAMGNTGLHNTLEPAVFGIPILIGSNHHKFPEAQAMIDNGGMFVIKEQSQFNEIVDHLIGDKELRKTSGASNARYIKNNKGAVIQILEYLSLYNNLE